MSGKKKFIEKDFKISAVKYKNEHPELTCDQIAENLGVSVSLIRRWVKEYSSAIANKPSNTSIFRGSGNYSSDEAKELARLKKENKDLKDALEILKKAMNILNSQ